jgi:hypothetical protein
MSSDNGLEGGKLVNHGTEERGKDEPERANLLVVVPRDSHKVVEPVGHGQFLEEGLVVGDDDELEVARVLALLDDGGERGGEGSVAGSEADMRSEEMVR